MKNDANRKKIVINVFTFTFEHIIYNKNIRLALMLFQQLATTNRAMGWGWLYAHLANFY